MAKENKEKKQTLDSKVYEEQIKVREEAEAAAENIDSVLEPEEPLTEFKPTAEELKEIKDAHYVQTSPEVVGFKDRNAQIDQYSVISNIIPEGSGVIDFGCGRGDYFNWYKTTYGVNKLDYIGIDANKVLIDTGIKLYTGIELINKDWSTLSPDVKRDWCINIGSNNLRYDLNPNKSDIDYLFETIEKMLKHCKTGIVITLTSSMDESDETFIKHDPGKILNRAQSKFGGVAIDHSSSNKEFILIIYKNEN